MRRGDLRRGFAETMKITDGLGGPKALADMIACRNDLRLVEAAGQSAWPAFASTNVHGWVWRNSGGGFGRSNSVFTLNFLGPDALEAIGEVERLYREEGRRARIRVSDLSEPKGLRELLIGRGYTVESAGLVMTKPTQRRSIDLAGVEWSQSPTPDWQKVYQGVIDEPRRRTIARLLAQVPRPHIFASYRLHGLTLSIGLAVLVDGIATLECIATREEARRCGGASKVLAGLEHWAFENGARTLHLQVAEHNAPGVAVYERFGFEKVGRFEYLVAPSGLVGPRDDGGAAHLVPRHHIALSPTSVGRWRQDRCRRVGTRKQDRGSFISMVGPAGPSQSLGMGRDPWRPRLNTGARGLSRPVRRICSLGRQHHCGQQPSERPSSRTRRTPSVAFRRSERS
jgi:ribosomal protein S18 acetylase RimI-like enzyme